MTTPEQRTPTSPSAISTKPSSRNLEDGWTTKSAFEITSISTAPIDNEELEGGGVSTSKDADELKHSIEGEKSSFRLSNSSVESEENHMTESSSSVQNDMDPTGNQIVMVANSNMLLPSNPSLKGQDIRDMTNGPSQVGSSRFRRVNQYHRGRWIVRDTYEPEERPESEAKMAPLPNTSKTPDIPNSSPSIIRKQQPLATLENSHDTKALVHSRSSSEVSNPMETHLPVRDIGTLSDKSSIITDPNQPLSPTTSTCSLIKSVDDEGDREIINRDIDMESVVSVPMQTPDIPTSYAPSTTTERVPQCSCDVCSKGSLQEIGGVEEYQQTLEDAMGHLREQFTLFMHSLSYQSILEERNKLLQENKTLKERISNLESQLEQKQLELDHHAPYPSN